MIYLATPYSHPDAAVREIRFKQVTYAASVLMQCGYHVFSPITHGHPMAEMSDLPKGFDYWGEQCKRQIAMCDRLVILTLEGHDTSKGVEAEYMEFFSQKNPKHIYYLDWEDLL